MNDSISEDGGGNFYPKYTSNNPVVKLLMDGFLKNLDLFVQQTSPKSIHEVGCGEGYIISRYISENITLKGSDLSTNIVNIAKTNIGLKKNDILFENKSIYDLQFNEDHAELVICSEVMEHLEDPNKALAVLAKIATRYLILSVPNEPLWRVMNVARGKYLKDYGNTPGHLNHWSTKGIINFVTPYFDVIKVATPTPWTMILCKPKSS